MHQDLWSQQKTMPRGHLVGPVSQPQMMMLKKESSPKIAWGIWHLVKTSPRFSEMYRIFLEQFSVLWIHTSSLSLNSFSSVFLMVIEYSKITGLRLINQHIMIISVKPKHRTRLNHIITIFFTLKNDGWWTNLQLFPHIKASKNDDFLDVVVVGGGVSGLTAAHRTGWIGWGMMIWWGLKARWWFQRFFIFTNFK